MQIYEYVSLDSNVCLQQSAECCTLRPHIPYRVCSVLPNVSLVCVSTINLHRLAKSSLCPKDFVDLSLNITLLVFP